VTAVIYLVAIISVIMGAWGLVTTKRPSGILLRDEKNRFAGYLSNKEGFEEE
jgi:hypothetical protein